MDAISASTPTSQSLAANIKLSVADKLRWLFDLPTHHSSSFLRERSASLPKSIQTPTTRVLQGTLHTSRWVRGRTLFYKRLLGALPLASEGIQLPFGAAM